MIACIRGSFVAFEFKSQTGKQSEVQKFNEREIHRNNGSYYVIRSFDEFKRIVDEACTNLNKKED